MKSALKIILWMLLGAIMLVLVAVGAFGFFIYKNMKSQVFDYTCSQYVNDVNGLGSLLADSKTETISDKMKPIGIMSALLGYTLIRENGELPDGLFEDKTRLVRYNDELTSICEKYPTLKPFDLAKDIKHKTVPLQATQKVNELLASVTVTAHPQGQAFFAIISQGMADRLALARKISDTQAVFVSPTTPISPTSAH